MPRRRRIADIGDILHVMARGLEGRPIFLDDADREMFIRLLVSNLSRAGCQCYAWALMPNHFHLVLRPLDQPAGILMRRLNGAYARCFNKKYKRRGYLFQDRFKSLATREFSYFRELIRYVHLNPVRSGIVKSLDELGGYRWTGHLAVMGGVELPWLSVTELLARFGQTVPQARKAYLQFLGDGVGVESGNGPLAAITGMAGDVKGDGEWIDDRVIGDAAKVRESIGRAEREEAARLKRLLNRPSLSELAADVTKANNVDPVVLQCRGRRNESSIIRGEFCNSARMKYGYTYRDIGAYLGITAAAVIKAIARAQRNDGGRKVGTDENETRDR